MILSYLLLISGLSISAIAEYYSIMGLMAIFSASPIPIAVMGISLGVAKLVMASWVKQYWARIPSGMKAYGVTAVVILMLITTIGCFGFLSKAHNDQNLVSGDVGAKLAIYDEKIATARSNIEADRKQLAQMDAAVDQVMTRSTNEQGADKANAIRNSQKRDRAQLAKDIETNQTIISKLNDEAAPIRAENRKVEAEVGPIKYIAAFIYGVAPDAGMLERAVTWIIIMIVIVFDPLAVIMLLASQMTFGWRKEIRQARARADDDGMVDSDPTIMPPPKTIFNVFADVLEKRINDFYSVRERFKPKSKPVPAMVEPTLEVPDHVLTNIAEGSEFAVTDTPAMEPYVEPVEAFWEDPVTLDAIEQHALNEALREELLISETIPESEPEGDYSLYVPHQNLVDALQELGDVPVFEQREAIPLEEEPAVEDEHPFRGRGLPLSMPMTASYMQHKLVEEIVKEAVTEAYPEVELTPVVPATPFTFEIIDNEPVEEMFEDKPESVIEEEPVLITRIAFPESNYNTSMDERPGDYVEPAREELIWTPATQVDADTAVQQLREAGYLTDTGEVNPDYVPDETGIEPESATPVVLEAGLHPGRKQKFLLPEAVADNDTIELGRASNSDFGNSFPLNPKKGDTYLRTDYLPSRLFKYNDFKWIEVDKESTDVYAYEEAYIKHLITEISEGRYDTDTLTDVERDQIADYLRKNA